MKFEMKNQWFKVRAKGSNFKALLASLAYDTEMRACLDLFEGIHLNFIRKEIGEADQDEEEDEEGGEWAYC